MATTTNDPQRVIPIPRRARVPKIALPGQPSNNGQFVQDEEAWHKEQSRMQVRAAKLHLANVERERAEREGGVRHITVSERLDGVPEINPPSQGVISVPARGPKVDADGRYIDDGDVPVKKSGKVGGRVAEAKKALGRVAAAKSRAKRA